MNAPLYPERLLRLQADDQLDLSLATSGVERYVWDSRFGQMLIEVTDGRMFVNGQPVEPAPPTASGMERRR
jgi:hypothetical protein